MTVPAAFTTALAQRHATAKVWLEVAGLPYAFGNFSETSAWFSARSDAQKFEGVKPLLGLDGDSFTPPQIAAQQIDHVEGRVDMGQLVVRLVDADGSLVDLWPTRRTDRRLTLETALPYSGATSMVVTRYRVGVSDEAGGTSDLTGLSSTGAMYLPRETIKYTALNTSTRTVTISNSTRGAYRSERSEHRGLSAETSLPGEVVTPYPRSLQGRRCWLYLGLDADDAADGVLLFSGAIRGASWANGTQELILDCDDWQGALKRPLFLDVFEGEDVELAADARFYLHQGKAALVGGIEGFRELDDLESISVLVRDRIATLTRRSFYDGIVGDLVGATIGWLPVPAEATEDSKYAITGRALIVAGSNAADGIGSTDFSSSHPLEILLAILTSTGTSLANGAYDTLPKAWGLGIPAEEIDVAGIERVARMTPGYAVCIPVLEAVKDAREWIVRELLKPFGFYLKPVLGSTVGIGWLHEPEPGELAAATVLTDGDLAVDERGQFVKFEGPAIQPDAIIGRFSVSASPLIVDGKLERETPAVVAWPPEVEVADAYLAARSVEIESNGLHKQGNAYFPSLMDQEAHFVALASAYATRFGLPPVVISAAFGLDRVTLNVGDLVSLQFDNVPSIYAASRGLTGVYGEVTQKSVDLARGVVELDITQSSLGTVQTRAFAPCAKVVSWNAGTTTLTIEQHEFTDASGSANDTDAFAAGASGTGYDVRVYSPDLSDRSGVARITSKTSTTLVLSAVPGTRTPSAGDIVMLADYGEQTAPAALTKFAYLSDATDGYLGTSDTSHAWDA